MNNNHSNNEFFGKSILITGASSGLGLALATFFLNSGANVIITGRDIESLNTLYNTFPKNTTVIPCNLCIDRDVVNLRNKVIEKFGSLDILIACAGMKYSGDIEKTFPDEFDEMVDINLRSVFILTKLFTEYFTINSSIVNISCLYGTRPFYGFMSHNMTKYGLEAFTKSAAAELASKKVRVNCVTSCAIDTNSLNYVKANKFEITHYIEQLKLNIPLGRIAYPHEVAKVVLFLCSDRSSTITGQVIKVDGGRSLTSSGYVHYKGIRNMNSVYEPNDVKLGIKYDFFGWNKSKEFTQKEIASMGEKELEEFIQQKCKESNFSTNNISAHIRHEVNYNKVEDNTMMLLNKNKK